MSTTRNILISLVLAGSAWAEEDEIKLDKLLEFEDVTIQEVHPDGITIFHKVGVARIPYEQLPKDLQENFSFDEDAASEHRKEVQAIQESARAERAHKKAVAEIEEHRVTLLGRVLQRLSDGILLEDASYSDGSTTEVKRPYRVRTGGGPNGLYPNRPYTYATRYKKVKVPNTFRLGLVFVHGATGYEETMTTVKAYPAGDYTYYNLLGIERSVPAFTTSMEAYVGRSSPE